MEKNYYEILGIKTFATSEEIERAYRKLVREFHPDRFKKEGEEAYKKAVERFTLINEAYNVLSDSEKRKKYDELLKKGEFTPPQTKAKKVQAKNTFKMGLEAFEKGEYSKASMYFKSSILLDPELLEARAYLALSYVRSGRNKSEVLEVLKIFDHYLDKINNSEQFYLLARSYLAIGEKGKAKEILERGLKVFKNDEKLNKLYKEIGGSIFKIFPFK
ncbi:MAG: DnaJ domain-containing protein [Candidatus Hydrothermales bacterium]